MLFFYQKIFKTLIFLGFFSCLLLIPEKVTGAASPESGVVAVDRLNMRQGRGIAQPLVKVLRKNDQVEVLARSKDWIKIRHEGEVGYISGQGNYISLGVDSGGGLRAEKINAAAANADDIRHQIEQQSKDLSVFNRQEKEVMGRLDKTDKALSDARREAAAMEAEMEKLSIQISDMKKKAAEVQKAIDASSGYAVKRLVALYKVDRLGESNLLVSAATLNDLLHRKAALEKILDHDSQVVAGLAAEKKRLSSLMGQLTEKKEKNEAVKTDYQKTIAELAAEKAERERLLFEIKGKKVNRLATIKYLKAAARKMDETIEALRQEQIRERKKAEARALREAQEQARLEAQQKEQVAAQKEARKKARQAADKVPVEPSSDVRIRETKKSRDEKPAPAPTAVNNPEPRTTAAKNMDMDDFAAHRGLLKMPVNGTVITKFGKYIEPNSGAVNFRKGIEIKAPQGTPVRAVFSGQTVFSSWLKGYGNVIIIAHGEHFHTVYAHVDAVLTAKGKPVEAGEEIATVGDSGSMIGPSLYFEIRHQGSSVNPLDWVK